MTVQLQISDWSAGTGFAYGEWAAGEFWIEARVEGTGFGSKGETFNVLEWSGPAISQGNTLSGRVQGASALPPMGEIASFAWKQGTLTEGVIVPEPSASSLLLAAALAICLLGHNHEKSNRVQ